MDIENAFNISASGMKAEGTRLRVIAENLANVDSTAQTPGGEPYRRKVISFSDELDRNSGAQMVKIGPVTFDKSDFQLRYDPGHPAANAEGYVLAPNVNGIVEMNDMKEAERSYEANLNVIDASRTMLMRTLDILRA